MSQNTPARVSTTLPLWAQGVTGSGGEPVTADDLVFTSDHYDAPCGVGRQVSRINKARFIHQNPKRPT